MKHSSESNEQSSSTSPVNNFNDDKLSQHNEMLTAVETRLNQIREYIKTTLVMMDSLKKASDPRAKTQHEKLGRLVEDLYDSEFKLSNLLIQYRLRGNENGNIVQENEEATGEDRDVNLYKKMEESQKKLTQLQEHQMQLVDMQKAMTESLNEARQLRSNLMLLDPQESADNVPEETEAQMLSLVGKLSQLQAKKQNMDQLIAELHATKIPDHSTSEGKSINEKEIELDGLKAQLAHLKALMDNVTKGKQANNEEESNEDIEDEVEDEENNGAMSNEEYIPSSRRPNVEEIQAVTEELKEQAALLQAARAEVAALKKTYSLRSSQNTTSNSPSNSPPSPPQNSASDQQASRGDHNNDKSEIHQLKQREESVRKDQSRDSSVNETPKNADYSSRRSSNFGQSRATNCNNFWPHSTFTGLQEYGIDGQFLPENSDVGLHIPFDNNAGNWLGAPYTPAVPPPIAGAVSSVEYYRQLCLGSQAHQIQMMNSAIQHCCQMLHSQQREMQLMRKAMNELHKQLRQSRTNDTNKKNNSHGFENSFDIDSSFNFGSLNTDSYHNLPTAVDNSSVIDIFPQERINKRVPFHCKDNLQDNLRR